MSRMIEDYALIGDLHTAALVARDGSIDWLCLPRFDSRACFAALLGEDRHGHWRIAPAEAGGRISRRYRPDTLILETEFVTGSGTVRLDRLHAAAQRRSGGGPDDRGRQRHGEDADDPGGQVGVRFCAPQDPAPGQRALRGRRVGGALAVQPGAPAAPARSSRWPSSRSAKATGSDSAPSGGHRG